ncbi:MAG TPA: SagB/ThcOx family dehydrogenase [Acidimicrobiales bacterium]|nr:SagB/ThcOx family dehydrogenase [Acidimicrobiales bacterium]
MTDTVASRKVELHSLVELLSEYECGHLLAAVSDVVAGERFWERDVGVMYNEYVKARYFDLSRNLSSLVPAGPVYDDEPFVPIPLVKSYPTATRVALPDPSASTAPTTDVLAQRRSRREYAPKPLTADQLSSLLHFAAGVTGFVQGYGYRRWPLRSFPSSGGLQTPELYVFVRDVEGLSSGLYHYQPLEHILEVLTDTYDGDLLAAIGLGQPYIQSAPVVFAITGYYARASWKYGERAFRYMCMDVGFLGQNLYIVAEALGLGACAIAGFIDDALERLLGVDSREEMAFLMFAVGPLAAATSDPISE